MDKRIKEIKKLKANIEESLERGVPVRPAWCKPGGENYYTDPNRDIRPLVITDEDWLNDYRGFLRRAIDIWGGSQDIDKPLTDPNPRAGIENLLVWCVAILAILTGVKPKSVIDKAKRKSENTKKALIAGYLLDYPTATSKEVSQATEIDDSDVRHLWGPIKAKIGTGKRDVLKGGATAEDVEDISKRCRICNAPLPGSFWCSLCDDNIKGECKQCHYTQTHPEDAIP